MHAEVRIDKWLWAARFFKTRGLAQAAVAGGKIHLNGQRVKPAHGVHPGDVLQITKGERQLTLEIAALSERRGPAPIARTLYTETPESIAAREKARAARKERAPAPAGRPDKRARRRLRELIGK